jgi:hypothetical protein
MTKVDDLPAAPACKRIWTCETEINTVRWIELFDEPRIFPSSAPLVEQLLPAEEKEQESSEAGRPLVASRTRKHEWGEVSPPLAETCRQAREAR